MGASVLQKADRAHKRITAVRVAMATVKKFFED
jgi:hypothetical protein